MGDIRFGIVGLGTIGSLYVRLLIGGSVPGGMLAAVCDVDESRLEQCPAPRTFSSLESLLASGSVDVIVVCTPHYSHVPVGLAAIEAGFHVVVDKPIAPTVGLARQLVSAPARRHQVLAMMFNQRLDPKYQMLRRLIRDGSLGTLQRMNWTITDWYRSEAYYQSGGWRATWAGEGGGVLLNQSPHQLDLWQWLFGMPKTVRAFCGFGRYHDIEVEDDVTAFMEYENGANGVFTTTTGEAPGTNRLEVAAENGRVVVEGNRIEFAENSVSAFEFSRSTQELMEKPEVAVRTTEFADTGPQHAGVLANVAAAIANQEELVSPLGDGIHSVELANAMILSSRLGQTVSLPLDAQAYDNELRGLVAEAGQREEP